MFIYICVNIIMQQRNYTVMMFQLELCATEDLFLSCAAIRLHDSILATRYPENNLAF